MFGAIIQNGADLVALILLFGVTIFVHELGHFLLALKCGMRVDTFSIGFGPAIWKKKVRGVTYKIGWFPIGGYVALPQLDPAGMSAIQGGEEKPAEALPPIAAWKKIVVSVAGASGNILFAFVLAWIVYLGSGEKPVETGAGTLVGFVETNSAAYRSGIRPGDEIVAVNSEAVANWNDFIVLCTLVSGKSSGVSLTLRSAEGDRQVDVPTIETEMGVPIVDGLGQAMLCVVGDIMPGGSAAEAGVQPGDIVKEFGGTRVVSTEHFVQLVAVRPGESCSMVVERNGERLELAVTPRYQAEAGRALVGVSVSSGFQNGVMPWMQHDKPLDQIKGDASGIVRILRALVTPSESRQAARGLGGPIMILAALWVSIKVSFLNAIGFLRFLNVNLAILNLLPIPVLDGGHIVFAAWETVTRRKVSPRLANVLTNIFMVLLLGVFLLLSFRDVVRMPSLLRAFRASADRVEENGSNEQGRANGGTPADATDSGR